MQGIDDLIKRYDAISEICKARTPDVVSHQYAEQFINAVCRAPSADRPQGKWIEMYRNGFGNMICMCSKCNFHASRSRYCPNCGARMEDENLEKSTPEVKKMDYSYPAATAEPQVVWTNYIPEACRSCSNHPANGGSGNCNCTLGSPKVTSTSTDCAWKGNK